MEKTQDLSIKEVKKVATEVGIGIVEQGKIPGQKPRLAPIPDELHPSLFNYLDSLYPEGLYTHQSEGIASILKKEDVALTTATASGKSLVYMAAAAHIVLKNPDARVLVFYPARALIQDQREKWKNFESLSISIGFIDGSVNVKSRESILKNNNVILMTPDVGHAWLLRMASSKVVSNFLNNLKLLTLDEAHVYEGAFGTNMAYFLRRLQALTKSSYNIVASSATLGEPQKFMKELIGRDLVCLTEKDNGALKPQKHLLLARGDNLTEISTLLITLSKKNKSPFLAFADSRKQVEHIVAITKRTERKEQDKEPVPGLLPYRAGYEAHDRENIQKALQEGNLAGVVSTSALELGLDIGDINLVVLLSTPPSIKAFNQRIGRGGRSSEAICLLLDNEGTIVASGLDEFLAKENEPNYLYLENRYIQYANVLCAGRELEERGETLQDKEVFDTVPERFKDFLENEMNPVEPVPADLFPLKQRGEVGPHFEFPLRNAVDKKFKVRLAKTPPGDDGLGTLTFSQGLREAYPGGIYYYLASPYRVIEFRHRQGEIIVRPERYYTTEPISHSVVFPNLDAGILKLFTDIGQKNFVIESHVQVSERVTGFYEKRGSAKKEKYEYGTGSPFYQTPLNNFFETTGVCLYFGEGPKLDQETASFIKWIFCKESGILEQDIGVGYYTSKSGIFGRDKTTGICIYDATSGSLRLTKLLAENFYKVIASALEVFKSFEKSGEVAKERDNDDSVESEANDKEKDERIKEELESLMDIASSLKQTNIYEAGTHAAVTREEYHDKNYQDSDDSKALVIAPGQKARAVIEPQRDVTIKNYRYTPKGIVYDLENPDIDRWALPEDKIQPIYGETQMLLVDLITGEEEESGPYQEVPK